MTRLIMLMVIFAGCSKEKESCIEGYERGPGDQCVPIEEGTPPGSDSAAPTDDSGGEPDPGDSGEPPADDSGDSPPPEPGPCDGPTGGDGRPSGRVQCLSGRCTVEAGSFWMGSVSGHADECPVRQMTLSEFQIDQKEVTWGAYEDCVETGACTAPPESCRNHGEELADENLHQFPVFCVTWSQARDYCSHVDGRLPTEAEWEKAARGERGSKWPWGDAVPTCDFANFRFVSWYCKPGVVAVGSYENASPYGALDMIGNAWEWVEDHYDAEWYQVSGDTDPAGPTENCHDAVGVEPTECYERVIRGGAYNVTEFNTRSAARGAAEPDRIDDNMGFRCAYDSAP